jgi:hypothetical protein
MSALINTKKSVLKQFRAAARTPDVAGVLDCAAASSCGWAPSSSHLGLGSPWGGSSFYLQSLVSPLAAASEPHKHCM